MSLSIVSLNCRGLRNITKRKAIFLYLKRFNADFCFLQECHSVTEDAQFWRSQWGLDLWFSHGTTKSAGVCILKDRFKGKILRSICDASGHYIVLATEILNETYIIVNVYGFNLQKENKALFNRLGKQVIQMLTIFPNSALIFGGDFNVVLDNSLDRWPHQTGIPNSDYIMAFIEQFSLFDPWRKSHPTQECFTWSNKSLSSQSRIDYWLTSNDLDNIVTDIIPSPFSDHAAISIMIPFRNFSNLTQKSGYWKLNNSVLKHKEVITGIEKIILTYWNKAKVEKKYCNNWELLKFEAGKFFRKYCSELAKKRRAEEDSIILKISTLSSKTIEELSESKKKQNLLNKRLN